METEANDKKEDVFSDISAEETPTIIESLCMNCHETGKTRLLLTRIPYFKEVILMAFHCSHCHFRNNEIQFGGSYAEKGVKYELTLTRPEDLNRQVVKSDHGRVLIPALDFEIPAITQQGSLNTIEGFIVQSIDALRGGQEERRAVAPEVADKIDEFLGKLEDYRSGKVLPFVFVIEDPSGNSYLENPHAPAADLNMTVTYFERTREQNQALGISQALQPPEAHEEEEKPEAHEEEGKTGAPKQIVYEVNKEDKKAVVHGDPTNPSIEYEKLDQEVMQFPGTCALCGAKGVTRMCLTDIPHFKQIVLMAFNCKKCGYKSNEVKGGGAIPDKGRKVILKASRHEDLTRDVLKSETSGISIPELELELVHGTLGGKFTTIEGLLHNIADDLKTGSFDMGDSSTKRQERMKEILSRLEAMATGKEPFTLVLDDPVGNCYIQDLFSPDPDPYLVTEEYERSWQQNEDLGLNDMKTENYHNDD